MASRKNKPSRGEPERRAAALAKLPEATLERRIRLAEASIRRMQRALIEKYVARGDEARMLLLIISEMEAQVQRTLRFTHDVMNELLGQR